MFGIFRKRVTYESYGYMCGDTMLHTLVEQPSRSASEETMIDPNSAEVTSIWKRPLATLAAGSDANFESVTRQLAILCLAFHQFCHIGLVSEAAAQRTLAGVMKRFDERFPGFSSDEFTVETTTAYLQAAADDIKNKSKSESFPTLVPLAIGRVVRLKPTDPNWPAASDVLYSLLDVILKTTEPMFTGMKKHAKLV
jgi:hypothetical protein